MHRSVEMSLESLDIAIQHVESGGGQIVKEQTDEPASEPEPVGDPAKTVVVDYARAYREAPDSPAIQAAKLEQKRRRRPNVEWGDVDPRITPEVVEQVKGVVDELNAWDQIHAPVDNSDQPTRRSVRMVPSSFSYTPVRELNNRNTPESLAGLIHEAIGIAGGMTALPDDRLRALAEAHGMPKSTSESGVRRDFRVMTVGTRGGSVFRYTSKE